MISDQLTSSAPSPQTTLLIILGAFEWPYDSAFLSDKAFEHAAKEIEKYFVDSFGIPKEHVLPLFNTDHNAIEIGRKIQEHIEKFKQRAKDIIIYYVGHAERTIKHRQLYLAIKDTHTYDREGTSLKIESLAKAVHMQARTLRRFYILDCCFSASAIPDLQGAKETDLLQIALEEVHKTHGYMALFSSDKLDVSVILPDHTNTFFTKALLQVLTTDDSGKSLSFRYVHKQINFRLSRLYKEYHSRYPNVVSPPDAEIYPSGDVADIPIFPNPFRFRNGKIASTVEELLKLCEQTLEDGIYHLMQGDFEKWLISVGREDLAYFAREVRIAPINDQKRFSLFIDCSKVLNYFRVSRERRFTFLLVGRTGVGKSSTINTLLGRKVAEIGDIEPETAEVKPYEIDIQGIPCLIIDTPGLCDGKDLDDTYIAQMRSVVGEGGVDCLWFVTPLSDTRLRPEETRAINTLTQAFGQEIWKRAVVVLTFADHLSRPEKYQDQLNKRPVMIRRAIVGTQNPDSNITGTRELPFVPITNEGETTPDGQRWLTPLYLATIERISPEGFGAFFLATQARLKMKEEHSNLMHLALALNTDHISSPDEKSVPQPTSEVHLVEDTSILLRKETSYTEYLNEHSLNTASSHQENLLKPKSTDTSSPIIIDQTIQQERFEEAVESQIEKATGLQEIFKTLSEALKILSEALKRGLSALGITELVDWLILAGKAIRGKREGE